MFSEKLTQPLRQWLLLATVAVLAAVIMVVFAAPAMANHSNNGNSQTRLTVTQICSSGDISIGDNNDNNGDNTRITVNSRGGCSHGKHHKHPRHHHRH